MSTQTVDVVLNHHWSHAGEDYLPGARVSVDRDTANRLRDAGVARPATVPDAKALGVNPDEASTMQESGT